MMELGNYPQRNERVIAKGVSESLVLLNLDNGEYYKLDEVGGRVWELCDGTQNVEEMVSTISEEYEASAETIRTDILELLRDLVHEKMVVEGRKTA